MGIRFRCHHCEHELHVKDYQGGKRGKCPECQGRFRVPLESSDYSLLPEADLAVITQVGSGDHLAGSVESLDTNPNAATNHRVPNLDSLSTSTDLSDSSASSRNTSNTSDQSEISENARSNLDSGGNSVGESTASTMDATTIEATNASRNSDTSSSGTASSPAVADPQAANVLSDPNAQWYVRPPSGGQYGPARNEHFVQWLQENRVTADSLVWRDGWPDWLIAGQVLPQYFAASQVAASQVAASPTPTGVEEASVARQPILSQPILSQPNLSQTPGNVSTSELAAAHVANPETIQQATIPVQADSAARQPSLGERNRLNRKQRRRKNYIIMMAVLSVLTVGLIIALIVILSLQSQSL